MNVRFRPFVIALGLTAATFSASFISAQGAENTNLRVENDTIDAGRVIAGREASVTYVFHNDGPTDITILRATPS